MREEKRHETEEDWEKSVTACRGRDAVIAEMVMQPNIKHYSLEFNLMSVSILALTCGRLQKKKRCSVTSWWTHLPWNKNWNSQLECERHLLIGNPDVITYTTKTKILTSPFQYFCRGTVTLRTVFKMVPCKGPLHARFFRGGWIDSVLWDRSQRARKQEAV